MGIGQTLKKLDIFGGQRGLTFSGEESHKTSVGAILTIVYLLLIVFFIIWYAQLFYTRKSNPTINSKQLIEELSPKLQFHENHFFFSVALLYQDIYVKPNVIQDILKVNVELGVSEITDESALKFKYIPYELEACTEEDFTIKERLIVANPERSPSIFSICVKDDNPDRYIEIDGEFHTANKSYLRVTISPCEGAGCRVDLNTIIEKESLKLILGMVEVSIDQNNYDNPYNYHFNSEREFNLFNEKTYVKKFFFEKSMIETDIGEFTKDFDNKTSMNFRNDMNQDKDRLAKTEPFAIFDFYSSNDIFKITRTYEKYQDLLSKIGGIVSVITLSMGMFYKFYNKISLKLDIMNKALLNNDIAGTGRKTKINFFMVLKFLFVKILSLFGCRSCFSDNTLILTTMYFNADGRVQDYLEVKAIVNNTRDVRLFRRIFFNKYQTRLLQKIENDTLLVESDHHYLDEEQKEIDGEEALKHVKDNLHTEDDVDRRINQFFYKLHQRIEEEKKEKSETPDGNRK